jgi:hypothetical protein
VANIGTATSNSLANGSTLSISTGAVPRGSLIVVGITNGPGGAFSGGVTDTAGNTYTFDHSAGLNFNGAANGNLNLYFAYNTSALSSGNSISVSNTGTAAPVAMTALYAVGIKTSADPRDSAASTGPAAGSSTSPTQTLAAAPSVPGALIIGVVGAQMNTSGFTQDSTNAAFASPPTLAATSSASPNVGVAGGYVIPRGQPTQTYAPTLSVSAPWAEFIEVFDPAPAGLLSRGVGR